MFQSHRRKAYERSYESSKIHFLDFFQLQKSRRKARQITTVFHRLNKDLKEAEESMAPNVREKREEVERIKSKIREIGGHEAYQQARYFYSV